MHKLKLYTASNGAWFFSACAPTATVLAPASLAVSAPRRDLCHRERGRGVVGQRREALADLGASICFLAGHKGKKSWKTNQGACGINLAQGEASLLQDQRRPILFSNSAIRSRGFLALQSEQDHNGLVTWRVSPILQGQAQCIAYSAGNGIDDSCQSIEKPSPWG